MNSEDKFKRYWEIQAIEGKKWQESRYQNNGLVWGKEGGPTVEYATQYFKQQNVKRILVIGCGYGRECIYFADHDFHVVGIDMSAEGIRLAHEWLTQEYRDNVRFLIGNALDLEFSNDSFDAIFSHKVFHQFNQQDRSMMLNEMHRVLSPHGVFVLSDLSVSDPEFGIGVEVEKHTFEREKRAYRPIHFMDANSLQEFSAFELVDVREIDFWETHPGEKVEHKHVFLRVTGRKME